MAQTARQASTKAPKAPKPQREKKPLAKLEGEALEQAQGVDNAGTVFLGVLREATAMPVSHMRAYRKFFNAKFIEITKVRRGDPLERKKARLARMILKAQKQLEELMK